VVGNTPVVVGLGVLRVEVDGLVVVFFSFSFPISMTFTAECMLFVATFFTT